MPYRLRSRGAFITISSPKFGAEVFFSVLHRCLGAGDDYHLEVGVAAGLEDGNIACA